MKILPLVTALMMSQSVFAKTDTQDLLRVTVDTEMGSEYRLFVDFDSETKAIQQITYTDGTPAVKIQFTPKDLTNGVVMREHETLIKNIPVIQLESDNGFTATRGGKLNLVVMRKLFDNRNLKLSLKQIDSIWKLFYVEEGGSVEKEFDGLGFYVLRKKDALPDSLTASPPTAGDEVGVKILELKKDEKVVAKKNTDDLPSK